MSHRACWHLTAAPLLSFAEAGRFVCAPFQLQSSVPERQASSLCLDQNWTWESNHCFAGEVKVSSFITAFWLATQARFASDKPPAHNWQAPSFNCTLTHHDPMPGLAKKLIKPRRRSPRAGRLARHSAQPSLADGSWPKCGLQRQSRTGCPEAANRLVRVLPLLRGVHGWIQKMNAVAVGAQKVQQLVEAAGGDLVDAAVHDRHVASPRAMDVPSPMGIGRALQFVNRWNAAATLLRPVGVHGVAIHEDDMVLGLVEGQQVPVSQRARIGADRITAGVVLASGI